MDTVRKDLVITQRFAIPVRNAGCTVDVSKFSYSIGYQFKMTPWHKIKNHMQIKSQSIESRSEWLNYISLRKTCVSICHAIPVISAERRMPI